jgi:protein MpaA
MRFRCLLNLGVAALICASCSATVVDMSAGEIEQAQPSETPASSVGVVTSSTTTSVAGDEAAPVAITSTSTSTSTSTTTVPRIDGSIGDRSELPSDVLMEFGRSILDVPLTVARHGDRDGARLLLVGSIHGDEDAGIAIVNELLGRDVPDGVELWLVPSMNPDGNSLQQRHNANGVDLNRNFPHQWAPLAEPGNWQYAGPSAASEPETSAMVALGELVNPDLVLWYHQDLFRISPTGGRNGEIRALYAEISGLPLLQVSGGTYTGTASMWSRTVTADDGTGFTVELGASLTDEQLEAHVSAVLAVAEQFYAS